MSKTVIGRSSAGNVEELEAALGMSKAKAMCRPEEIYFVTDEGGPVVLHLIEETLSDGGIVYEIEVK